MTLPPSPAAAMLLGAFLACFAAPPARADCSALMQAHGVAEPPDRLKSQERTPENFITIADCSIAQTAMFEMNHAAIAAASPADRPADLHGVWLGDDVLRMVLGLEVAALEVLEIGPGPDAGTLSLRQYLFVPPGNTDFADTAFDSDGRYQGLLAEARLRLEDGSWRPDKATWEDVAVTYPERRFSDERVTDLELKGRFAWLERGGRFLLADDVLVLVAERVDPLTRQISDQTRTYSRIAPGSADAALIAVTQLRLPMSVKFECFTLAFTSPPDELAALLTPRVRDGLNGLAWIDQRSRQLTAGMETAPAATKLLEVRALMQEQARLTGQPDIAALIAFLTSDGFCP